MAPRLESEREVLLQGLTKILEAGEDREAVLNSILKKQGNERRRLLTQMLYGTLRSWFFLEPRLSEFTARKALPRPLVIHLVFALYQALELKSVPEYAARSELLQNLPRKFRGLKSVVDAVFKNFLRKYKTLPESPILPEWWLEEFTAACPAEFREQVLAKFGQIPTVYGYRNHKRESVNALAQTERQNQQEQGTLFCDPASFLAAQLVMPQKNEHVLDLCSAPGNKALALLQLQPDIHLTCVEKNPLRARILQDRLPATASCVVIDALEYLKSIPDESLDRILLDAPCSAWGTVLIHPEYLLRKDRDQSEAGLQCQILRACIPKLKRGGTLVYSVCTFRPEETIAMGEMLSEEFPNLLLTTPQDPGDDLVWTSYGAGKLLLPIAVGQQIFWYIRLMKDAG